ncbi:substrate-binding periplasmic protein [Thaumasiovibrio subtropicus]|uniref:substrate-binding periplasmic protein n=1 Tax=Thaumasiovibrio subtropicus TaxID=1891207 RepID=UPI00131B90D5|nr:transporter substrate-binding domain-containing protein [Thaumasiovibrio subtropicus]
MGYRTTSRIPKIAAAPDNSGIYKALYEEAAQRIGCKLTIIRLPKQRLMRMLNSGEIDFYPGFTFTEKRAEHIHFAINGLPSLNVGLTLAEVREVTDYRQLEGKTLLLSLGGPVPDGLPQNINFKTPPELNFHTAIEMIVTNKADFFEAEIAELSYYLKSHPDRERVRFHYHCCGGYQPLLLGFSRQSPLYNSEANPDYRSSLPLSFKNQTHRSTSDSIATRFFRALQRMQEDGSTHALFEEHYGIHPRNFLDSMVTKE